jgi:lipopolysaccharide export system permease protein
VGKIVHRYIFREILVPCLFGLTIFTFILLIARLLKLIELVVTRDVPVLNILKILSYILPAFLEVTVPMAMLLAILVAFGRLSADAEMVALRSSGLSLYQLLAPVAIFALLATGATAALSVWGRPWGNRELKMALFDLARARASAGIKQQVFNDDFPGLVIYAETIDSTHDRLRHVLISDERDSNQHNTIFAREGVMVSDPSTQAVTLRLRDGSIRTTDTQAGPQYQTQFQFYDVNLDLRQMVAGVRQRERDAKELTLGQLQRAIATKSAAGLPYTGELIEYHRKFAIPFACIVFALVAVPLGVQPVRAARSRGFTLSLAMIFTYYVLLSIGQALAEQAILPVAVGLWLPNAIFAGFGLVLFVSAARERTLVQLERLQGGLALLRARLAAAVSS